MRFHDVLIREYFRLGLLGRSAGCNTLVAQLSHDVAAHGGTHLQLVLGWQTAQVLQIGRNSLADHDRAGESETLLLAQVGAAPRLSLGLVVAQGSTARRCHSIRIIHKRIREHVVL